MRKSISEEECKGFATITGRRKLIEKYGASPDMYAGKNEDDEDVIAFIGSRGIVLQTNQSNGWCRINYYDADGCPSGETFEGRWRNTAI